MKAMLQFFRRIVLGICVISLFITQPGSQVDANHAAIEQLPAAAQALEALPSPFELVNHLGGQSYAVLALGSTLYAGFGPELAIVDISVPASPVRLGFAILPGIIRDIFVAGDFAYTVLSEAGVGVVDISDPAKPIYLGVYDSPGNAEGVTYANGYVFLADGSSGLRVVSVLDPTSPTEVASYPTLDAAKEVAVYGSYLYVAANTAGICIFDISAPVALVDLGCVDVAGAAQAITIQGSILSLAADYRGFRVLDIADPAHPVEIGFVDDIGYIDAVSVAGELAFASSWYASELLIIDITNPRAPHVLQTVGGFYWEWMYVFQSAAVNDYIYVCGGDLGLFIVNIHDPTAPVEARRYGGSGPVSDLGMENQYLYAADGRLRIYDITDPLAITGFDVFNAYQHSRLEAFNGYLFANITDVYPPRLVIFDVTDPAHPELQSATEINGRMEDCVFSDPYVYIGSDYPGGWLQILDVSDPTAPLSVGEYQNTIYIHRVALQGQFLHFVDEWSKVSIMNVSNPAAPFEVSQYYVPNYYPTDVQISGDYAFISLENTNDVGGLGIVNVSNPLAPVVVSSLITSGATRVALVDDYAEDYLLLGDDTELQLINTSDLNNPFLVGVTSLANPAEDMLWKDGFVYTASGTGGIFVYQLKLSSARGTVTGANGLPVEGVTIELGSAETTTAVDGDYSFTGIFPGSYTITPPFLSGFAFFPPSIDVTLPPDHLDQDFTVLPRPVVVTLTPGTVTRVSILDIQGLEAEFTFPADAVTVPVVVVVIPSLWSGAGGYTFTGHAFDLGIIEDLSINSEFSFNAPISLEIEYSDADIRVVNDESQLILWRGTALSFTDAAFSCDPPSAVSRDLVNNVFQINICRLGNYILTGPAHQIMLPLIGKQ